MRLLASLAATAALLVAVPATPASAVTTGGTLHIVTAGTENFAPSTITVARGTELEVANSPVNPAAYTYMVGNGTSSWSTGAVAPGSTGRVTLPTAGTFSLTRVGGSAVGTVIVL